jgi:hypothetical protein
LHVRIHTDPQNWRIAIIFGKKDSKFSLGLRLKMSLTLAVWKFFKGPNSNLLTYVAFLNGAIRNPIWTGNTTALEEG